MNDVVVNYIKNEVILFVDENNVKESRIYIYTKSDGSAFTDEEKEKLCVGKDDTTISSDNKTITDKYDNEPESISEYFADGGSEDGSYTYNYTVKLFQDESILRIIYSGIDDGEPYEWWNDYKKVN